MIELYFKIEEIWFKINEKIRFILVGGFNTVFAYLLFLLLYYFFPDHYNIDLTIQYIITINLSFITMRYYVFRGSGDIRVEYMKSASVYLLGFVFNYLTLNFFVIICRINPAISQMFCIVLNAVLTFVLHKYYSFRNKKGEKND